MRVSCSVRAHPERADLVATLVGRLGIGSDRVVWDRHGDSWDTGARAWQAYDPDADWHLVLEDDAIVCRDLLPGLARALDHLPRECVVSLYTGNQEAARGIVTAMTTAVDSAASWVLADRLVWGVGIALPVSSIPAMLDACDGRGAPYDTRIASYYRQRRWPAYYPCPSLIDHAEVPSLLGHTPGRRATAFVGEGSSALDFDGSGSVIRVRPRRSAQIKETPTMPLLVAQRSAVVYYNGKRTVIRKDVTTAEQGAAIVREHPKLWRSMTVDFPAKDQPVEQATAAPGEKRDLPAAGKIREWARDQGYEVPDRGKLPGEVIDAYRSAHASPEGD